MRVDKVLLLFQCLMKGQTRGQELAFVRYTEAVPSLHGVGKALRCVCLRWMTASSAKKERVVGKMTEH